ncbi:MAG: dimethyl sulfoxide reductase anchor subunit [Gammaproteobacteria bacterium]|nr:dimethyl sulfoxide reductase anchor subunit [Gammaproteobacteria bacterium]
MYEVRDDEPGYAFVPDVKTPEVNQWGRAIETTQAAELRGQSLTINGDEAVSENPNRYKQHGFHFTADNCIGCHACEAACSEKNDLPAHISFRSVGYLEGGTYPAYKRLNISMACNHCDNPVCLKGCPTRAYTKFAEYGAVLQDPDICFGCGYCTWVCPYNAPQLDPVKGEVSKCNMCVDRLEVGLKPACASACLGGALDFGIIESKPENREQAKLRIPGFPTPEITNPNIRFQQTRSLPRELTRIDTQPIKYQRDEQGLGEYKVKPISADSNKAWSLRKLRSREDPLVLFTLISQLVVGGFTAIFALPLFGVDSLSASSNPTTFAITLLCMMLMQSFALAISTMHLGKPHRFYRAFNNIKYSPVSREVASLAVFFSLFMTYLANHFFGSLLWSMQTSQTLGLALGSLSVFTGLIFIYAMHKIYRIEARPYWNHWQVLTSFFGSVLSLGGLFVGAIFSLSLYLQGENNGALLSLLAWPVFIGLLMESAGIYFHKRDMNKAEGEGLAALNVQHSQFGLSHRFRNISFIVAMTGFITLANVELTSGLTFVFWCGLSALVVAASTIGRAMFYVMVIPTTMPGAFFWRNEGFQTHARESGLAAMPQTGVLPKTDYHHEQLQRAKDDIRNELTTLRQKGLFKFLKLRWQKRFKSVVSQA